MDGRLANGKKRIIAAGQADDFNSDVFFGGASQYLPHHVDGYSTQD